MNLFWCTRLLSNDNTIILGSKVDKRNVASQRGKFERKKSSDESDGKDIEHRYTSATTDPANFSSGEQSGTDNESGYIQYSSTKTQKTIR